MITLPLDFRWGSKPSFILRVASRDVDPVTTIQFYPFKQTINRRETTLYSFKKAEDSNAIPFVAVKYGEFSFRITPVSVLVPGEYSLRNTLTQEFFCFGVDGPGEPVTAPTDVTTLTEPEFDNTYYALNGGTLIPLERLTLTNDSQTSRKLFAATIQNYAVAKGAASPIQITSTSHFVVRLNRGDVDPQTVLRLRRFELRKGDRQLLFESETMAGVGKPFKKTPVEGDIVTVTTKPYGGTSSLEIIPAALLPGQYCFMTRETNAAQCFGVTGK